MNQNSKEQDISGRLELILRRRTGPEAAELVRTLERGTFSLLSAGPELRPADREGLAGGLIRLKPGGYFVIVPDLHGRMDFFLAVMMWPGFSGKAVINDMAEGKAQVICVGDAFHSESRGRERWGRAMDEWASGYRRHRNMDGEMMENLGLLEMISTVKSAFPEEFHFLKGNHENIANESGEGNYPFGKFAREGEMVKSWVLKFLGKEGFDAIYTWEKALPLMTEGPDFLVSHSEPGRSVTPEEVINFREVPDLIYELTWTGNGQALPGSVAGTLENFNIRHPRGRIFGGHRPVRGLYALRQNGKYVQINTPNDWVVAVFNGMEDFNPDKSIICLSRGV